MNRRLAIALGLCLLGASLAHAQCAPSSQDQLKCQDKLAKALGKLAATVIKCHVKQADNAFKSTPVDDEACEETDAVKSAKAKFNATVTKVTPNCPDTSVISAANAIRDQILGTSFPLSLDDINGQIYCDGSIPIDLTGDDAGNIPSSQDFLKCEDAAHKNLSKLISNVLKCHIKNFDSIFKNQTFDLNFCENDSVKGAAGKYNAKVAKINEKPCPNCLDTTAQTNLGSTVKGNVDGIIPDIYPCPTTSTSTSTSSSTTSTSSTSTTSTLPCACGSPPTKVTYTTAGGVGNCGVATAFDGSTFTNLACSGLYFGGGQNSVPLPAISPDYGGSIYKVALCSGSQLYLEGTSNGQLGANQRDCTNVGCFYGAPLPIPNTNSTPTSTCVINTVSVDAVGTAECAGGTAHITIPLNSEIYLSGDLFVDAPGIQVCPVCTQTCNAGSNTGGPCNDDSGCPGGGAGSCAGSTICHGGANDGNGCSPADTNLGTAGPTSHDCPPDPLDDIGGLPIGYVLSSGTIAATAIPSGTQTRVFCGYCRDADGTGSFKQPAVKCLDTTPGGPATGTCSQPFESCEQNFQGAFGPGGGAVKTLSETGTPAGNLTDHLTHNGTLVSIFCIPSTFNATVDQAANLPGPGAVSLPGTAQVQ
jgi:hypothetical protein